MNAINRLDARADQMRALWRSGNAEQALRLGEAIVREQEDAQTLGLLAEMYSTTAQPKRALQCLERLILLRADDAAAWRRLAEAQMAADHCAQAALSYRRALEIEPGSARAHNNLGQALLRLERTEEARASFALAIEQDPGYAIAHNNLGNAQHLMGAFSEAVEHYQRAVALQPALAEAHQNCANALLRCGRNREALLSLERTLQLLPNSSRAWISRGDVLQRLARYEEAVASYRRALVIEPDSARAYSNCTPALLRLHQLGEALQFCRRAIEIKPGLAEAHSNLGAVLRVQHHFEEAERALESALQHNGNCAEAWSNLADLRLAQSQPEEARQCCERALALQPSLAEVHYLHAGALSALRRFEEALGAYARVEELAPQRNNLPGMMLGTALAACQWREFTTRRAGILRQVTLGESASPPLILVNLCESPQLLLSCARTFSDEQYPPSTRRARSSSHKSADRIRIAYLSSDFHQHATAILMAGLFESHDRQRFECIGVSFGPDDGSPMRRRLEAAFDRFIDVRNCSDAEAAEQVRAAGVDIAVDLKGHTGDSRTGILACRPAPVQVQYLGYPGTMGFDPIDYVIADSIVLPPEQAAHYAEQVGWMPECYQVNDRRREIAPTTPDRAELGLPAEAFVFCCFNNNHKILPELFDVWMRILVRIPGSVLWLLEDNAAAADNLRREAGLRGVDRARLVFAARLAPAQHLARHRRADLFLDTLPYNAHTTGSDALWAGLPVLTCQGDAFAGRVGASLLQAAGLPELVAGSLGEYEALATALALDPQRLQQLRLRLERNRDTCPLFDTTRFSRHLESAYQVMWDRFERGMPAQSFAVPAIAEYLPLDGAC